jgi:hypothetical protein
LAGGKTGILDFSRALVSPIVANFDVEQLFYKYGIKKVSELIHAGITKRLT